MGETYVDDWRLALNADLDPGLGNVDFKISAFDIAGYGDGYVEVADRLGPLIG